MKVNVSIDDISIHPRSSLAVLDQCYSLIEEFNEIKFTLFVPIAYWRKFGETRTDKPLWIHTNDEFMESLRSLPKENFEIGIHGIFHSSEHSNNNEMLFLNNELGALSYIQYIHSYFTEYEIDFSNVVRPCGWAISPITAKTFNSYFNGDFCLSLHKDYCPDPLLETIKQNSINTVWCDCCPPFLPLIRKPKTEIVYHACEWDKNYLSKDKASELKNFLSRMKNHDTLDFTFIREVVKNG